MQSADQNASGKPVNMGKSPTLSAIPGSKRDSGYGTDFTNSPASQSSGTSAPKPVFVFGSSDTDIDFCEHLEQMDLNDSEDVFADGSNVVDVDNDDTDKEVEEFFSDSVELPHSVSEPIAIQRPQAPIPTPEGDNNVGLGDYSVSRPYHHTMWTRRDRQRHRFRPIASRSFGTQTPSPHSQILREEYGHSIRPLRPNGRAAHLSRLKMRSESERSDSPLPDVVPRGRDRSGSLPAVPSFQLAQEQEVGRELRRISDEFHSSFTPVRRRGQPAHSSSFPRRVSIDVQACWSRIRRIVSSSSVGQDRDDQPPTPFR